MKYKIVVPYSGQNEEFKKCVSKCKDPSNLILVLNYPDKSIEKFCIDIGAETHPFVGENRGSSESWNIGMKKFETDDIDFLIIMSPSALFLNKMEDFVDAIIDNEKNEHRLLYSVPAFNSETIGWHCFAIARIVFESVGYFDECIYPAYGEDADYLRRIKIVKDHGGFCGYIYQGKSLPDVKRICQGISLGTRDPMVYDHYLKNIPFRTSYYARKWGGPVAQEIYEFPFNGNDVKLCEKRTSGFIPFSSIKGCENPSWRDIDYWDKLYGGQRWK